MVASVTTTARVAGTNEPPAVTIQRTNGTSELNAPATNAVTEPQKPATNATVEASTASEAGKGVAQGKPAQLPSFAQNEDAVKTRKQIALKFASAICFINLVFQNPNQSNKGSFAAGSFCDVR